VNDFTLALDLSNIRAWWSVAQLAYDDDLQGGRKDNYINDVGDTLKAQAATFSPPISTIFKVWLLIAEKVPNQDAIELQQMQSAMPKIVH
jgi:hypothetical protein